MSANAADSGGVAAVGGGDRSVTEGSAGSHGNGNMSNPLKKLQQLTEADLDPSGGGCTRSTANVQQQQRQRSSPAVTNTQHTLQNPHGTRISPLKAAACSPASANSPIPHSQIPASPSSSSSSSSAAASQQQRGALSSIGGANTNINTSQSTAAARVIHHQHHYQEGGANVAALPQSTVQFMDLGQFPSQTSKANTMAWHQQNYMIDSGINSTQSTAAPSIASSHGSHRSRLSDLGDDEGFAAAWERQYRSNISHLSEADISRSQKIKSGLMAETATTPSTIDEGFVSPASGMHSSDIYSSFPPGGPPPPPTSQQHMMMGPNNLHSSSSSSIDDSAMTSPCKGGMGMGLGDGAGSKPAGSLSQLLSDDDPIVVQQAVEVVLECTKIESKKTYIINSLPIIQTIVRLIEKQNNDPQTVLLCAGVLHNISADPDYPQGLLAIFKSGGVPALLNLLESKTQVILYNAITTLHNLLLKQEGSTHAVRITPRGVERIVALLKQPIPSTGADAGSATPPANQSQTNTPPNGSTGTAPQINEKFLAIVCDCLQLISYNNSEGKKLVLEAGGTSEILRIMRTHQYEKLLWTASRVLKVLSVCSENKRVIVNLGGMQIIGNLLLSQSHSFRLVVNCLLSLRNLSDIATQLEGLDSLIITLSSILSQSVNTNEINIICCILSNLMCNNQSNKTLLTQNNGVQSLIHVISNFSSRDDIVEPAICTLRHLSTRHQECETAQHHIRTCNGIAIINQIGLQSNKWSLMKASVGLFRNLTLSQNNHSHFRSCGLINTMVNLCAQLWNEIQSIKSSNVQTSNSTTAECKKREDLLESCISTLQHLSRDFQNRELIRNCGYPQNNSIVLFAQMLFSSSCTTLKLSSGLLSELTKDNDVTNSPTPVLREPAVHTRLQELVGHSDQHIASYSSGILFNLADEAMAASSANSTGNNSRKSTATSTSTANTLQSSQTALNPSHLPQSSQPSPFKCHSGVSSSSQGSNPQQLLPPHPQNIQSPTSFQQYNIATNLPHQLSHHPHPGSPDPSSNVSPQQNMLQQTSQPWNMRTVLESVPSPNASVVASVGYAGGGQLQTSHLIARSPVPVQSPNSQSSRMMSGGASGHDSPRSPIAMMGPDVHRQHVYPQNERLSYEQSTVHHHAMQQQQHYQIQHSNQDSSPHMQLYHPQQQFNPNIQSHSYFPNQPPSNHPTPPQHHHHHGPPMSSVAPIVSGPPIPPRGQQIMGGGESTSSNSNRSQVSNQQQQSMFSSSSHHFNAPQLPSVHQSFNDIPTQEMTDLDFPSFDAVNDFFAPDTGLQESDSDLMDQSGNASIPMDFFTSTELDANIDLGNANNNYPMR